MITKLDSIWNRVLDIIAKTVGEKRYSLWFKETKLSSIKDDTCEIGVPNLFVCNWLKEHFYDVIKSSLKEACEQDYTVKIYVDGKLFKSRRKKTQQQKEQILTEIVSHSENPSITEQNPEKLKQKLLNNFVVGPCNQMAYAVAKQIVTGDSKIYNPVFIHGGAGLGKTHILLGIYNELKRTGSSKKAIYVDCETFTNQFIYALKSKNLDTFRNKFRNVDVLIIDDIHFLTNKTAIQEEFLHTYNSLNANRSQIIFASDAHPKAIKDLKKALINRFVSGMVVKLDPPDYEMRMKILRAKCKEIRNEPLDDDILGYLASKITTSVRELEGALTTVLAYESLSKEKLTFENVEIILNTFINEIAQQRLDLPTIEQVICETYDVTSKDLRSNKRSKKITFPRQLFMYLAREMLKNSYNEIGQHLDGKNHSAVIFAYKKISSLLQNGHEELNKKINFLREEIKSRIR